MSKEALSKTIKSHKKIFSVIVALTVIAIACAVILVCYKSHSEKKLAPTTTEKQIEAADLVCHTFTKIDKRGMEEKYEYYCHGDEVINIKQYSTIDTSKQTKEFNDELSQLVKSRQEIYPEFSDFVKYTYKMNDVYVVESIEITDVTNHMFELMQIGMIHDPDGTMTYVSLKQVESELLADGYTKE